MHEWVDIFDWVGRGGLGALVCGGAGALIGFANGNDAADKAENMKWGAIIGVFVGVALGVIVLAPE
jgi:hypothetical protein